MFPTSSRLGLAGVCPSAAIALEMAAQACPSRVRALEVAIRTCLAAAERTLEMDVRACFGAAKVCEMDAPVCLVAARALGMAVWVCNGDALVSNRLEGCAQNCCSTTLAGTTKIYSTTLCFPRVFFLESSVCVFLAICFRISDLYDSAVDQVTTIDVVARRRQEVRTTRLIYRLLPLPPYPWSSMAR